VKVADILGILGAAIRLAALALAVGAVGIHGFPFTLINTSAIAIIILAPLPSTSLLAAASSLVTWCPKSANSTGAARKGPSHAELAIELTIIRC